jgi:hypothetical protein
MLVPLDVHLPEIFDEHESKTEDEFGIPEAVARN